ncbi:hypothetical protein F5H01DRAFT_361244 [Linnemannia elongata]|nr:hypothetical protein F5H01DRAFT_361244 [Linnemannia elongata]
MAPWVPETPPRAKKKTTKLNFWTYMFLIYATNCWSMGASMGKKGRIPFTRGLPVPDRDLDPKWHVSDVLRGITPKSMLSEWSSVFRSPKSIAQTVLHKFVGYLETQSSERIWTP